MLAAMKIKASAVVLALCGTLLAEGPVELKWPLAKGDRFGMEISSEAHQEHNETENNYESTRTLRLSAVMEVVEAEGGAAKVEIRVHRTTGKSRVKEEEVEDTDLKAGFLKSIESRFTMETRLPSKGKPLDLATTARTVTLSKLEPAKK